MLVMRGKWHSWIKLINELITIKHYNFILLFMFLSIANFWRFQDRYQKFKNWNYFIDNSWSMISKIPIRTTFCIKMITSPFLILSKIVQKLSTRQLIPQKFSWRLEDFRQSEWTRGPILGQMPKYLYSLRIYLQGEIFAINFIK